MSFLAELRRRNVYRVATAYVIVGWLVMQVVDVMQPALRLPEWVATLFAVVLLITFPIALILSWVYDVTPEGIVRTSAAAGDARHRTMHRLDILIVAGLALVAGLIVWQQLRPAARDAQLDNTIAVLPFEDLSPEGDQRYFADGISEEILNALARQPSLRVTGRTSSFSFRESARTLSEIGASLGVSALLEGSVRKQGDSVRVVARLVHAGDGAMLWNETYDSRLDDIFAIQERVAERVMVAMAAQLDDRGTDGEAAPAFDVYDDYLRARDLIATRRPEAILEAQGILKTVVALDADYAPPLAQLAISERLLAFMPGTVGNRPLTESIPKAIEYADRAIALDPGLADAHAVRGLLYLDERELLRSEASLRRALEINPTHTNARLWLSSCLGGKLHFRESQAELITLFERDPLFPPASSNLIIASITVGDTAQAQAVIDRLERLEAPERLISIARTWLGFDSGDVASTVRLLDDLWQSDRLPTTAAPLALLRLRLGDIEGAGRINLPFVPIRSRLLEGDAEAALDIARRLLEESAGFYVFQIEYIRALADAGRDSTLIEYYDREFGDVATFERRMFWQHTADPAPYWALAYAMHRTGDTAALEPVMAHWRRALDVARANGVDNFNFDLNEAQWYAIRGETDTAVEYLQRAAGHTGGLLEARTRYDYLNTLLEGHPDFEQLMEDNLRRINEERAALGIDALVL